MMTNISNLIGKEIVAGGDNIRAVLPSIIGSTIGEAVAGGLTQRPQRDELVMSSEIDDGRVDHPGYGGDRVPGNILEQMRAAAAVQGETIDLAQLRAGGSGFDGYALLMGDANRAAVMSDAVSTIRELQGFLSSGDGPEGFQQDLYEAAMVYELTAAEPGALRRLMGGDLQNDFAWIEAYRSGADELAAALPSDARQALAGWRDGPMGDVFTFYVDNAIQITAFGNIARGTVFTETERSQLLKGLGSDYNDLTSMFKAAANGSFDSLNASFVQAATKDLTTWDIDQLQYGVYASTGRRNWGSVLSMATGGLLGGRIGGGGSSAASLARSGLSAVMRRGMGTRVLLDAAGREVKVFGQIVNSTSKTPGHAKAAEELVQQLAKTGEYEYFTLQRAWRTATGRIGSSRLQPDVIGVRRTGQVDAWEVRSMTDRDTVLLARLRQGQSTLPAARQGRVAVIPPRP